MTMVSTWGDAKATPDAMIVDRIEVRMMMRGHGAPIVMTRMNHAVGYLIVSAAIGGAVSSSVAVSVAMLRDAVSCADEAS